MASSSLRLPDELKAEATAYARTLGISLNALCAVALRDYLNTPERKPVAQPAKAVQRVLAEPQRVEERSASMLGSATVPKVGANQLCPCGSGEKYKRCHGKV